MGDFQQQVKTALIDVFDAESTDEREIERVAKQASKLRTAIQKNSSYDLELSVTLIVKQLEDRAEGGPEWAWNNWVGSLEFADEAPGGHQI